MRSFFGIFGIFLSLSSFAQQTFERKGFLFGASIGGSSLSLSSQLTGDETQLGGSFPNLKLGAMLSSRTALVLVLPGTVYQHKWSGRTRDRGFEGIVPAVQFWAKDRWWLLGGAGLAMDAPAFYDIQGESERKFYFGAGGIVGTGYEIWRRGRFALDVQVRAHFGAVKISDERLKGAAFSVLVGANFY